MNHRLKQLERSKRNEGGGGGQKLYTIQNV